MQEKMKNCSNNRNTFLIIGMAISGLILFIVLMPSLVAAIFLGPSIFFPEQIYSVKSPNGKFTINISKKLNFPVWRILNPTWTGYISFKNTTTDYELNSVQFYVPDRSSITEPEIIWMPEEVRINKIDSQEEHSFILSTSKH